MGMPDFRIDIIIFATLAAAKPNAAPTFLRTHGQISRNNRDHQRHAKRSSTHHAPLSKYKKILNQQLPWRNKGGANMRCKCNTKGD